MRRFLFVVLVLVIAITQIAAVGPATSTAAFAVATALMFVLPFIPFKQLKLSGPNMVLATMAIAAVVTIGAAFFSGDLTSANLNVKDLVVAGGALWAITQ